MIRPIFSIPFVCIEPNSVWSVLSLKCVPDRIAERLLLFYVAKIVD